MLESYLTGRSVDMDTEVTRFTNRLRKESVPRVNEVTMPSQPAIRLGAQQTFILSGEMCVGMQKPHRSTVTCISPRPNHKSAVEVYSGLYQKRICSNRSKEFRSSGLHCALFEDHTLSLRQRQQLDHATMPFIRRRFIREFKPGFQFCQDAGFVPLRAEPWRVADLQVETALVEYTREPQFPVEEALVGRYPFDRGQPGEALGQAVDRIHVQVEGVFHLVLVRAQVGEVVEGAPQGAFLDVLAAEEGLGEVEPVVQGSQRDRGALDDGRLGGAGLLRGGLGQGEPAGRFAEEGVHFPDHGLPGHG